MTSARIAVVLSALAVMAVFYQEGRIRGLQRAIGPTEPNEPDLNAEAEHLDIQDRIDALEARLDQLQSVAQSKVASGAPAEEAVHDPVRDRLNSEQREIDAQDEERLRTRRQERNREHTIELTHDLKLTPDQAERLLVVLNTHDDQVQSLIEWLSSAPKGNEREADLRLDRITKQKEQEIGAILDAHQLEAYKALEENNK